MMIRLIRRVSPNAIECEFPGEGRVSMVHEGGRWLGKFADGRVASVATADLQPYSWADESHPLWTRDDYERFLA